MDSQIFAKCAWSSRQYTIEEIEGALDLAEAALGLPAARAPVRAAPGASSVGSFQVSGTPAAVFAGSVRGSPMTANAWAGLARREWVNTLLPAEKDALAWKIALDSAMQPLADSEKATWLPVLFGFADLRAMGAQGAREAAQAWSKTSPRRYGSDAMFDKDWYSFDPDRPDAITVGSLIHHAETVGVDLTPWRDLARSRLNSNALTPYMQRMSFGGGTVAAHLLRNPFTPPAQPFFSPIRFDPAHLHPVSWLVPNLLIRGQVSVLVGQGAGAKTALALHKAVSLAAGRTQIGSIWLKPHSNGLKIAFISAEEGPNELGLLVAAACNQLNFTPTEQARVAANLEIHDAQTSGWMLGRPQRHGKGEIEPETSDQALHQLTAVLAAFDLLILDNLAGLLFLPNENDNHAITLLMERLTRAARLADCAVLLLHHTPKMTREAAAALRGEATLARGGSAITTRARVVLTLTAPTASEAAGFVVQGYQADRVRRLEHGKVNDVPPMEPLYLTTVSVDVQVFDGSKHPVRAIEFIQLPPHGGITDAVRNVVMKAVDEGVKDKQGARVPLSHGGGRNTDRAAAPAIGKALQRASSELTQAQAEALGRNVLKDLIETGCVEATDMPIPQYRQGRRNGTQPRRGLRARWDLVPWALSGADQLDASQQQPIAGTIKLPSDASADPGEPLLGQTPARSGMPAEEPSAEGSSTEQIGAAQVVLLTDPEAGDAME